MLFIAVTGDIRVPEALKRSPQPELQVNWLQLGGAVTDIEADTMTWSWGSVWDRCLRRLRVRDGHAPVLHLLVAVGGPPEPARWLISRAVARAVRQIRL